VITTIDVGVEARVRASVTLATLADGIGVAGELPELGGCANYPMYLLSCVTCPHAQLLLHLVFFWTLLPIASLVECSRQQHKQQHIVQAVQLG
jgi:hypothetical protein